ncbi:MAG TPA: hypothetical protein VJH21_02010 [Candidatus Paceibacterota bacterium]
MKTRTAVGIIAGFILFLVGGTLWYQTQDTEVPKQEPVLEHRYVPQIINAKHQFKNGLHTIVGEVDLPTSCYLLSTDTVVEVREPRVDRATVRFNTAGDDEICAQVITTARFKETFSAQEKTEIIATWNGLDVLLNLIEARPDDNLDNFELFIKG